MTAFRSWLCGLVAMATLVVPAGLPVGDAGAQERREEERSAREREERPAREREARPSEREVLQRQVEVMRVALHALREANRQDAMELMERAIRAREVTLEGRQDEEARAIRERGPNRGQLAELLTMASNQWREYNNQDKAEVVGRLAREFAGGDERRRPRAEEGDRPRAEEGDRPRAEQRDRPRPDARPNEEVRRKLQELEQALVRAREAGREEEVEQLRRQMRELTQRPAENPVRRPAVEAARLAEEVERLKGSMRELNAQMTEMLRPDGRDPQAAGSRCPEAAR